MRKLLIVFGTRPELIKLAPIINEFRKRNQRERLYIVDANQHKDIVQEDLKYFQIDCDHQFKLTRNDDSLSLLNGLLLLEFNALKSKLKNQNITIDTIIAQGDTCTSFSASQFAFYEKIPFAHVEAGLRTNDFGQPFPEEYFRKTISTIATIHFAPTISAQKNLINEGVSVDSIMITGNTVIDNLRQFKDINDFKNSKSKDDQLILITIHRRENVQSKLALIISQIIYFVESNPNKSFIWIDNIGYKIAPSINVKLANLKIVPPVSFCEMIKFYKKAQLIITDSGGIQEESTYLGIPTLLFRNKTERTEGINFGISKYAEDSDTNADVIIEMLSKNEQTEFNTIFGDGYASERIVDFLTGREF